MAKAHYQAPPAETMTEHPLLAASDGLFVQQRFEPGELCSCEIPNRFKVYPLSSEGKKAATPMPSMYVAERTAGVCDCLYKQCCGPIREMTSDVYLGPTGDDNQNITATIHKSCGIANCICCRSRTTVFPHDGSNSSFVIDDTESPCDLYNVFCGLRFHALNLTFSGGCMFCADNPCCNYPMTISRSLGSEGDIDESNPKAGRSELTKIAGGCGEFCTGTNRYAAKFPPGATFAERLALLASVIHLDANYFEQSKNNN
jgi:hypothetical protein